MQNLAKNCHLFSRKMFKFWFELSLITSWSDQQIDANHFRLMRISEKFWFECTRFAGIWKFSFFRVWAPPRSKNRKNRALWKWGLIFLVMASNRLLPIPNTFFCPLGPTNKSGGPTATPSYKMLNPVFCIWKKILKKELFWDRHDNFDGRYLLPEEIFGIFLSRVVKCLKRAFKKVYGRWG